MRATLPQLVATFCFVMAIVHTFSVGFFQKWARRFPEGSVGENGLHLLGEVEAVFGIWATFYLIFLGFHDGSTAPTLYLERQNFTEPAFVFVIMVVSATRPILNVAISCIKTLSRLLPLKRPVAFYATCLFVGPLLGSFITEPAAMTVIALILLERFYKAGISSSLKYATLGLLFVNVSIGGTLTPYAAPPILMVAGKWNWDLNFMLANFGWKAALACLLSVMVVTWRFRKELGKVAWPSGSEDRKSKGVPTPLWVTLIYLGFLALIVKNGHHLVVFAGIFLLFLGVANVTREYLGELKLREGLLVGFFLAGLVVLGGPQRWWLEPLLLQLEALPLFLGATALTAITDNAALTYLGSQVPSLSESARYALVAGAVTGGGLTVIANAPNPAGYGILNSAFGKSGIQPLQLFLQALLPTLIAAACFWFL